MDGIQLNKSQFLEFDQFDQFGFFYDEDGCPREDSDDTFEDDVDELYKQYDSILVTPRDDIYGIKGTNQELIFSSATEAYLIAEEVTEDIN